MSLDHDRAEFELAANANPMSRRSLLVAAGAAGTALATGLALAGDAPGLQADGLAAVLECFRYWIHVISPNSRYDAGEFP